MSLRGKKSLEIEIKSCGRVFHELFGQKPHETPKHTPDLVQGCELHEGEWGVDGYVITWSYFHEGKNQLSKCIVHVNKAEKWITWDLIGGDLKELYKSFLFTCKVDKKGQYNLVTWIFDYEKLHEDVPDPDSYLDFFTKLTKGVEKSHLKNNK